MCLATMFVGCENSDNKADSGYPFSSSITVALVNDVLGKRGGDLVQLDSEEGTFLVVITEDTILEKQNATHTGYSEISVYDYAIIKPGDTVEFAYIQSNVDYNKKPLMVRASLVRVLK